MAHVALNFPVHTKIQLLSFEERFGEPVCEQVWVCEVKRKY